MVSHCRWFHITDGVTLQMVSHYRWFHITDGFTLQMVSGVCLVYVVSSGTFHTIFGSFVQLIIFILPLIILVYCYGRIVWVLHRRINTNTTESQSNLGDKFLLARTNTIKTFLLVGLCFIICWSQNQVYYLMFNLGFDANWNSVYYKYTILMVFLNCTVNPFIYLIKYEDYQKALGNFVSCGKGEPKTRVVCSNGPSMSTVEGT